MTDKEVMTDKERAELVWRLRRLIPHNDSAAIPALAADEIVSLAAERDRLAADLQRILASAGHVGAGKTVDGKGAIE